MKKSNNRTEYILDYERSVFDMKQQFITSVMLTIALLAMISVNAFTANAEKIGSNLEGKGVFSNNLMNAIREIKEKITEKNKHSPLSEEKSKEELINTMTQLLQNVSNEVAILSYSEYFENLVNRELGPTEETVCNSNAYNCSISLANAFTAWESAERDYPNELHNRRGDALRHALWQGYTTFDVSKSYAKQWGDAHEADWPTEQIEHDMDYYNNSVGRDIGEDNWFDRRYVTRDIYNGITDGIFKIIVDGELVWSDYLN